MSQDSKDAVGVVVGRFQVPKPHEGHRYTISYALQRHREVLILVGEYEMMTDRNELNFEMRKGMLERAYPGAPLTIVALGALPSSYEARSKLLDALLMKLFPGRDFVIYGARDSIIHKYRGVFKTVEVQTVFSGSSTEIRKQIKIKSTEDFLAGVIYAVDHRPPLAYPTVDVAVLERHRGEVLLIAKQEDEGKLRFPGVFFNPVTDNSYEDAAHRCVVKELPSVLTAIPRIIGSCKIEDWHFRKTRDGIVTLLVSATYVSGDLTPGRGIERVHWVPFGKVPKVIVECHLPLADLMRTHWRD